MRLDDEKESSNYEIQRGGGRGGFGGLGGGGGGNNLISMLLPMIGSKFGCTGIVIALAVLAFLNFSGSGLLTGDMASTPTEQGAPAAGSQGDLTEIQSFSLKVLGTTERVWGEVFREHGQTYKPAVLSFYSQNGQSGCGAAQSAMGPFYCPLDNKIYLDTDFFRELQQRFGAPGDFAQAYVIAHEVGHHIQNLEGTLTEVRNAQKNASETQANALQVKVELQADCYAGVWGKRTGLMEPGDIEEGMRAAEAIGDDTLQRQAGRRPMPDSFTHGSSADRMAWLRRGLETGNPALCDTFKKDS